MSGNIEMRDDLLKCLSVLRKGGLIVYPTDTIWGIGCDATNAQAVERVYALKRRTDSHAMLSLVDSANRISQYVDDMPMLAYQLIEITDRPLTIVYDHAHGLAANLLGENGSAGMRVTSDPFCRELCCQFGRPIVSTSANISGQPAPATYAQISDEILQGVDYVSTWRRDDIKHHQASSVIGLSADGTIKIYRF